MALPLLHLSKPWTMRDYEVDPGRRIKATGQQSFVVASLCLKPPGWSVEEQACRVTQWVGQRVCGTKTTCAAGISTSQSLRLRGKKGNPKKSRALQPHILLTLAKLGQSYKVLCSAFRSWKRTLMQVVWQLPISEIVTKPWGRLSTRQVLAPPLIRLAGGAEIGQDGRIRSEWWWWIGWVGASHHQKIRWDHGGSRGQQGGNDTEPARVFDWNEVG